MIAALIVFEVILQITRGGGGGLIFVTPANLMMIFRQMVYNGIIAFGLTLVMMTGNIDLSVGNMLTFTCCVAASVMMSTNNPALAVLATLGRGAPLRPVQRHPEVSYVKLNSFITTPGCQLHLQRAGYDRLPLAPCWSSPTTAPSASGPSAAPLRPGQHSGDLVRGGGP